MKVKHSASFNILSTDPSKGNVNEVKVSRYGVAGASSFSIS
jgi:hypothetical protein